MFRITRVLAAVLLAAPLAGLTAQSTGSRSSGILTGLEGKKVRLSVSVVDGDESAGWVDIRGKIFEARGDSIHVLQDGGHISRIALSNVRSLDVSRGRDRWLGAGFGALLGVGGGLLLSTSPIDCDGEGYGVDCRNDGSRPTSVQYVRSNAGMGLLLGVILGGAIGTERWQHVLSRPRVSVAPARGGGIRVGVSY